jgi:hypothetical protein
MITMTKDPLATHAPQNERPNCGRSGSRFLSDSLPVPEVGLEPTRPFGRRILSPLRLPFRHSGLNNYANLLTV